MQICDPEFEGLYAIAHYFGMEHDIPKLLDKLMEVLGGGQSALARRLSAPGRHGQKITQPQISRWKRGQEPERPNYDRIIVLARELGVLSDVRSEDVAASLPDRRRRTVKLKGYVGASGEAFYYRLSDEELDEVTAPDGATDQTVAVEVRGKSLGPLLESWLVFYNDVRSPITEDLLGRLCVVGLSDDRILVKRIEKTSAGYNLISNNNEDPILNAEIEWGARVTAMRPR